MPVCAVTQPSSSAERRWQIDDVQSVLVGPVVLVVPFLLEPVELAAVGNPSKNKSK